MNYSNLPEATLADLGREGVEVILLTPIADGKIDPATGKLKPGPVAFEDTMRVRLTVLREWLKASL